MRDFAARCTWPSLCNSLILPPSAGDKAQNVMEALRKPQWQTVALISDKQALWKFTEQLLSKLNKTKTGFVTFEEFKTVRDAYKWFL